VDSRQQRAVTAAAAVNAALIAVPPLVLALRSTLAADNVVRPPGVSGLPPILTMLPLIYVLAGLGALAGWRTHVHATAYAEGKSAGRRSVLEPAALGLVVAVALLWNGIRTNPGEAAPYILAYGGGAALFGLLIGVVLRFTALAIMWAVGRKRTDSGTR